MTKKIVILGAGFGGTYTYKNLSRLLSRRQNIEIVLVDKHNYFLFTPLLHEMATGGQSPINIVEPLRKVLNCRHTEFHLGAVKAINIETKSVATTHGAINYDYLVLALGSTTNYFNTPGAEENCYTLKSIACATRLKNQIIANFEKASFSPESEEQEKLLRLVVIGGGPTGVELAAELAEFCHQTFAPYYPKLTSKVKVILLQAGAELLPQFPPELRRRSLRALRRQGVEVKLNTKVISVGADEITLDNKQVLGTNLPIWVAGVKPQTIKFDLAVARDQKGRLLLNEYLQLIDHPEIFALGDLAGTAPMLAQAAVKQGQSAAANLQRLLLHKPLKAFNYRHRGDLISLGRWQAAGQIAGIAFSGRFAWWLWRMVYLFKMLSWQKKVKVALDWTINLFSARDISEL